MSAATNRQIADAFRAARKRIALGKNRYICIALDDSCHLARRAAQRIVMRRLRGDSTVSQWLYGRGFITCQRMDRELCEYRLRWLDALIEEFDPATGSASHG